MCMESGQCMSAMTELDGMGRMSLRMLFLLI